MDTLSMERVMQQCWSEAWPKVAVAAELELSVASGMEVMQRMLGLMKRVCAGGSRSWWEQSDATEPVLEREGEVLRFKLVSETKFFTLCGPVVVSRRLSQKDRGGPTVSPLEEAWGMVGQSATPEIREIAAFALGLTTAKEAAELLAKASLCPVGVTTLKSLAGEFGEWVEEHPAVIAEVRAAEEIPQETRIVCASLDGANLRLAEPGPKPGRPVAGDAGEPAKTCFQNAMVGTVSLSGSVPPQEKTPTRWQTRCVARMPEEGSPTFRTQFEAEVADTLARCPPEVQQVLVLDAGKSLWHDIASQPLFDDFEKIVDFIHAIEHVAEASDALFGKGTHAAQAWTARHRHSRLDHDDGPQRIMRAIDYALKSHRVSRSGRTEARKQRQYFHNNSARMTDASFRARGLPIGSGPVEAAGKTLVKTRLCRSGMRWTRTGGQHLLNLRTLIRSDRWTPTWTRDLASLQSA